MPIDEAKLNTENVFQDNLAKVLLEIGKRYPAATLAILSLLTSLGLQATIGSYANVSAQTSWAQATENTVNNGTVPEPTPNPRPDNLFQFTLVDENGVNPLDARMSARYTEPVEDSLFYRNGLEQDNPVHSFGAHLDPGQTIEFTLETPDETTILHSYDTIYNSVESVSISNVLPDETGKKLIISAAPEDLTTQEVQAGTQITATMDSLSESELMDINVSGPTFGESSLQVEGLVTGTLELNIQSLVKAQSVQAAGVNAEPLNIGSISGEAPQGIEGHVTINGETFIFDSQAPFSNEHSLQLNNSGELVIGEYDLNDDGQVDDDDDVEGKPTFSNTLFMPATSKQ